MRSSLLRTLAAALALLQAPAALAITQVIKREVPLNVQTAYLKGIPVSLGSSTVRGMAFDGTQVWVALVDASDVVRRVDIASNKAVGDITLPVGSYPNALVFDGTYMWVFCMNLNKAYKYSTAGALQSGFPITLSGGVRGAAFGPAMTSPEADYIWASTVNGTVDRINVTSRAVSTISGVGTRGAVAFDGKYVWVSDVDTGIAKIQASNSAIVWADPGLRGPSSVNGIAFDGRFVWVSSQSEHLVRKIDPTTNAVVATVATYADPRNLAFDGTHMWLTSYESMVIQKVDVRSNQIVDVIQLAAGSHPYAAVFDGSHVWVNADAEPPINSTAFLNKYLATHN